VISHQLFWTFAGTLYPLLLTYGVSGGSLPSSVLPYGSVNTLGCTH